MAPKNLQTINWEPLFEYVHDNFMTKKEIKKLMSTEASRILAKIDEVTKKQELANIIVGKVLKGSATRQNIEQLREELLQKFSHLPTREQFYKKMDKWMKAASTADIEKPLHKRDHEQIRKVILNAR